MLEVQHSSPGRRISDPLWQRRTIVTQTLQLGTRCSRMRISDAAITQHGGIETKWPGKRIKDLPKWRLSIAGHDDHSEKRLQYVQR